MEPGHAIYLGHVFRPCIQVMYSGRHIFRLCIQVMYSGVETQSNALQIGVK